MIPVLLSYEKSYDGRLTELFGNPHGPFMAVNYSFTDNKQVFVSVLSPIDGCRYALSKDKLTPCSIKQSVEDLL